MPYATNDALPDAVKTALPQAQARGIWRNTFNSQQERGLSEERSFASAWAAVKAAGYEKDPDSGTWHKVEKAQIQVAIGKSDDARQLLFGWASVAADHEGTPVLDSQGDLIDLEDLEEAFYDYVKSAGTLNFMHDGPVRGHLVEALVFTPEKVAKLGIPPGTVPYGAWVGYHIPDPQDYALVKGYGMFSIEGSAQREEVS